MILDGRGSRDPAASREPEVSAVSRSAGVPSRAAGKQTRRRGTALEQAILRAGWELLVEEGYRNFTYEGVAARARTSRPVLYRRWPKRSDLLLATMRYGGSQMGREIPDTGTLRGDMIALLSWVNSTRVEFFALLVGQLGAYYSESGSSPSDLRQVFIEGRPSMVKTVLDRAVQRGEADPARITERIVELPIDLVRQRIMMTLKPAPQTEIEAIVDEIFLPLVLPAE